MGFAIPFSITQNLQQTSKDQVFYYYYNRPIISKLLPNYGPATGGNEIELLGSAFDPFIELPPHFRMLEDTEGSMAKQHQFTEVNRMNKNDTFCMFIGLGTELGKSKAKIVSSTRALCTAPASTIDFSEVWLTLNNQQYSDDEVIYYWYKAAKLYDMDPKYGPTEGGTKVQIFGTDF